MWEPVLFTDWLPPSTMTLDRILDPRARQYWDKGRLVSHALGEHNEKTIVWDYIAVYPPGILWTDRPPEPLYHDGPVVKVTTAAHAALARALSVDPALAR